MPRPALSRKRTLGKLNAGRGTSLAVDGGIVEPVPGGKATSGIYLSSISHFALLTPKKVNNRIDSDEVIMFEL